MACLEISPYGHNVETSMTDWADRIAVVTGAGGALGQTVVQHFQNLGATVVAIDCSREHLEALDVDAYACDLTDEEEVRDTFERIHTSYKRIDILANIAGGFAMGKRVEETTPQDWMEMLNINAVTAWRACACVIPIMRAAGFGRIVNVGARAVRKPAAKMAPYCVSKAAVITLTEVLALECAEDGITVNCILPGTIDTPRNRADMPKADHSKWVPTQDLATAIAHLADPSNNSVNGAVVPVYGRS